MSSSQGPRAPRPGQPWQPPQAPTGAPQPTANPWQGQAPWQQQAPVQQPPVPQAPQPDAGAWQGEHPVSSGSTDEKYNTVFLVGRLQQERRRALIAGSVIALGVMVLIAIVLSLMPDAQLVLPPNPAPGSDVTAPAAPPEAPPPAPPATP